MRGGLAAAVVGDLLCVGCSSSGDGEGGAASGAEPTDDVEATLDPAEAIAFAVLSVPVFCPSNGS